jgi:type II secretory pathway component PulK
VSLARQRGVALLVAIVLFALATMLAAAITYSKAMAARRAAATFTMEQALQAGMAAEALAGIVLEADADKTRTSLDQDWAQPLGPVEIEGTDVWIQAQVEDISGRFNLNSVVMADPQGTGYIENPQQVAVFRQLLNDLDIEDRYADLLVDWIDTDIAPSGAQGGEDTLYLSQNPPYRPPNTFISHTSELLALPGFGAERFKKIAPYVTALPLDVTINVCTAQKLVLDISKNDPSNQNEFANSGRGPQKGLQPDARRLPRRHIDGGPQDPGANASRRQVQLVPPAHQRSCWHCRVRSIQCPFPRTRQESAHRTAQFRKRMRR